MKSIFKKIFSDLAFDISEIPKRKICIYDIISMSVQGLRKKQPLSDKINLCKGEIL